MRFFGLIFVIAGVAFLFFPEASTSYAESAGRKPVIAVWVHSIATAMANGGIKGNPGWYFGGLGVAIFFLEMITARFGKPQGPFDGEDD